MLKKNGFKKGKWNDIVKPQYMYGLGVGEFSGFKITRFAYQNIQQVKKVLSKNEIEYKRYPIMHHQ